MRIIGCDLHARQQSLAMLETTTGEVVNLTLMHEGNEVREFYSELPRPVLVGVAAAAKSPRFHPNPLREAARASAQRRPRCRRGRNLLKLVARKT